MTVIGFSIDRLLLCAVVCTTLWVIYRDCHRLSVMVLDYYNVCFHAVESVVSSAMWRSFAFCRRFPCFPALVACRVETGSMWCCRRPIAATSVSRSANRSVFDMLIWWCGWREWRRLARCRHVTCVSSGSFCAIDLIIFSVCYCSMFANLLKAVFYGGCMCVYTLLWCAGILVLDLVIVYTCLDGCIDLIPTSNLQIQRELRNEIQREKKNCEALKGK